MAVNAIEYTNPMTEKRDNAKAGEPFEIDSEIGKQLKDSGAARELTEGEIALFEKQQALAEKQLTASKAKTAAKTKATPAAKATATKANDAAAKAKAEADQAEADAAAAKAKKDNDVV
jgi:hypothetical protein